MKMKSRIHLGLLCAAALLVGSFPAAQPPANAWSSTFMPMQWTATNNWLSCDQTSANSECADWKTPDGVAYMSCCIPPSALGTSDRDACQDGGRARDGRGDL